jgi:hypothetical protein
VLRSVLGNPLGRCFNPFAPHVIVTGSDDTAIKAWSVPAEGIAAPITSSDYTFECRQKKDTLLNWHPTASNVLMSCFADNTINGAMTPIAPPAFPSISSPPTPLPFRQPLVVHMGGKGETSIKHFEIADDAPYCHFLAAFNSKEPERGIA